MEVGISTLSKKGQITIPKAARKQLSIGPGDRVLFMIEDDKVLLQRVKGKGLSETLDS